MPEAVSNTVIGILVVFGALVFFSFVISLLKYVNLIGKKKEAKAEEKALAVFFSNLISVLMHMNDKTIPPLYTELVKLPKGLRIFGAYLLAHQAYLKKDYRRALDITDMALTLPEEEYPLPKIYIHLIATVSLVNTKHIDDARPTAIPIFADTKIFGNVGF